VRFVLLGTLSAILLGLLVGAGSIVTSRRTRGAGPATAVADEDERHAGSAVATVRRREVLPSVGVGCVPRAGWACWRGRLRLSADVVRAWRAGRAARRAKRAAAATEILRVGTSSAARVTLPASPDTNDSAGDDSDPVTEFADVPLPPDSGFRAFFDVRVYRTSGGDGTDAHRDGASEDGSSVELEDDGSFEIQVAPGRYGLEVTSGDDLLAGGRDQLRAVPADFADGVDVVLEPTVSLAGRVLDEDGLLLSAIVTIARVGDDEKATLTQSDGAFQFDDLRPGPVRVTAEADDGQTTTMTFLAPLQDVVLHLARPRAGLLLVPRAPDGSCPRGVLSLTPHPAAAPGLPPADAPSNKAAPPASPRVVRIVECQAIVGNIAPGSAWDVAGSIGPAAIKTRVQFGFGTPLAPLCLTSGCDPMMAVLDVRPVDLEGRELEATVTVKASPPGGPRVGMIVYSWQRSMPANQSVTVDVSVGATSVTRQLWLRPGVNREVVRLPVRQAEVEESETVTVE